MTKRLYYQDGLLLDFSARVTGRETVGETIRVRLDQSAFYPTSGGQLFDIGTIGGVPVVDVLEEDSDVVHILSATPDFAVGDSVEGKVDPVRRRDNMQKHTGQHILSQALIVTCQAETVSSRLGEDDCTVEVNREALEEDQICRAEELANILVFENRPVTIDSVPYDKLGTLPLRKIPDRQEGEFRIVTIADFDWSACGGTHCRATGSVGMIKITGREKLRGHLRLHFLTGLSALADYRWRFEQVEGISTLLTRHGRESAAAVATLLDENLRLRRKVGELKKELLPTLIDRWVAQGIQRDDLTIVPLDFSGEDFKEAKDIALAIINSRPAVVVAGCDDKLLIAVGKDLPVSAAELLKKVVSRYGGRGGGSPQIAQGGGFSTADIKVLLAHPEGIFD